MLQRMPCAPTSRWKFSLVYPEQVSPLKVPRVMPGDRSPWRDVCTKQFGYTVSPNAGPLRNVAFINPPAFA
mgnify:CR=1 FL=1